MTADVSSVILKINVDSVMPDFLVNVPSVREHWLYLITFALLVVLIDTSKKIEFARNASTNASDAKTPLAVKLVMQDITSRELIDVRLHVIGASFL